MAALYLNEPVRRDPLPVREYHLDTPVEEYNLNFIWPLRVLESSGLRLEPLIPSKHAKYLFEKLSQPPGDSVYRFFALSPPKTLAEYLTTLEEIFRSSSTATVFVLYDTSFSEPRIAGSIAVWKASAVNLSYEIGFVSILPEFRRTHVTTQAAGLLIKYALEAPPEGLGLRRVFWQANTLNQPSINAALRLGFKHEGTILFDQVLNPWKEGNPVEGSDKPSRHNWSGAINIDDWKAGSKEKLELLMAREVVKKD